MRRMSAPAPGVTNTLGPIHTCSTRIAHSIFLAHVDIFIHRTYIQDVCLCYRAPFINGISIYRRSAKQICGTTITREDIEMRGIGRDINLDLDA